MGEREKNKVLESLKDFWSFVNLESPACVYRYELTGSDNYSRDGQERKILESLKDF
jgi:hypothetical protein